MSHRPTSTLNRSRQACLPTGPTPVGTGPRRLSPFGDFAEGTVTGRQASTEPSRPVTAGEQIWRRLTSARSGGFADWVSQLGVPAHAAERQSEVPMKQAVGLHLDWSRQCPRALPLGWYESRLWRAVRLYCSLKLVYCQPTPPVSLTHDSCCRVLLLCCDSVVALWLSLS